ncbi:alkaline phosphatase family protein [Beduini massiliensis]|uniref:alkaline phosphatase family protein n=1 Tax=Beduini massiliensis TaxID=1585974 RepID=UPI0006947C2A|nr:alkaline phosphatase family protein [Beduini massiliensis]
MKKKMTNTWIACVIVLVALAATFISRANACGDCKVNAAAFTFSAEERLPQTIIQKIVDDFINRPLANGKERKKVLILGYDGFREDGLNNIYDIENSAILSIMDSGGLYHSFAGGLEDSSQATSTSPGWSSILTGGWHDYHGVEDNGIPKKDVPTLFQTAVQKGYSTTFVSSWKEHFETVYTQDMIRAELLNEPSQYIFATNDEDSKNQAIEAIKQDFDIVMAIAECTDNAGHSSGFGNDNPIYQEACQEADHWGKEILNAVKERETYPKEEWLVIITTDHGGIDLHHGGQSDEERNTWFAVNQPVTPNSEWLNYHK